MARWRRALRSPLPWVAALFVALLFGMRALAPLFALAFPGISPEIYARESFFVLWLSHAVFVALSGLASAVLGVGVAILVTRDFGREFRPIAGAATVIGQTFPPAAVLALAVPAVGYGAVPTLIALTLYGLLPVVANATAGLESVPPDAKEAAAGLGFSPARLLFEVELPLAAPAILAGIRTSVAIGIGTAALGSTVGAVTLGTPIISGLYGNRPPWVIQGALVVGLFAILTDMVFERIARRLGGRGPDPIAGKSAA